MNSIGQRMGVTTTFNLGQGNQSNPGLTAWAYNSSGELVEANDNGTANIDRAYQYDAIGNREKTVNGLQGNLPATPNYVANPLNQYTRANGITLPMGNDPAYDADGNYQRGPLPTAPTTEAALVWDTENRLVRVTKSNGDVIATDYDYLGRRISKTVTPSGGSSITTHFLYDGWNLIAEYTGTTLTKTYTCGLDLSGTLQGAGGVGGLLAVSEHSGTSQNPARTPFYPTFDGNGNVSEYLDGDGVVQAHYEYDPFGNTVVSSGAKAADFRHRFSTKYLDTETGLYYYGYRYLDPLTGRWPSRDPIEEEGGLNLYGFVGNDGVIWIDYLGLRILQTEIDAFIPGRLGVWLNEPGIVLNPNYSLSEFKSDERTFGVGPGRSSRISIQLSIASESIGELVKSDIKFEVGGSGSDRRRWRIPIWPFTSKGNYWEYRHEPHQNSGEIERVFNYFDKEYNKCSMINFSAAGAYPFSKLAPPLRISGFWNFCRCYDKSSIPPGWATTTLYMQHAVFPNHEAIADGSSIYQYDTPYGGPAILFLHGYVTTAGNGVSVPVD